MRISFGGMPTKRMHPRIVRQRHRSRSKAYGFPFVGSPVSLMVHPIGLMADRIGLMADRIGLMAHRLRDVDAANGSSRSRQTLVDGPVSQRATPLC